MTNCELRIANVEKSCRLSGFRRFCGGFLILSLIPLSSCGRYLARDELKLNDCYSEILKRVDRDWIGDDRFFENNLLANPAPEIRQWCAIALGRIGSPSALPLLYRATHTGNAAVRAASAFSIGAIEDREVLGQQHLSPDPRVAMELKPLLDDPSISVRMRAVEALGKTGSRGDAEEIARRLENFKYSDSAIERAYLGFAITALVRLNDAAALPFLERLANSSDSGIQWRALDALVRLHDEKAVPLYIRKLESEYPEVQFYAARGLSILGPGAISQLSTLLLPRDSRTGKSIPLLVRSGAIQTLGELRDAAAIPSIKAAIEADPIDQAHPDQQNFVIQAAGALGEIGSGEAEPVLLPLLNSVQPVANGAVAALAEILKGNPEKFFGVVDRNRFAIALPHKAGFTSKLGNPGPSTASVTDAVCRTIAASRRNSTIATIETTRGTLELELFREDAPLTAASFVLMAKSGAYNGFVFEQVVPSQRIGEMDSGSQEGFGRAMRGELNLRPFERGSVGMAAAGGKKDNRRLFITLSPQPLLDGIDTCFGRVISGVQVADKIVPGDRILRISIKETISILDRLRY